MAMKIKQVRVYQSVFFEGAERSYFNSKEYMDTMTTRPNAPVVDIQETEEGVILRSVRDTIKVFRTNISAISYMEVADPKKISDSVEPKKVSKSKEA